MIMIENHRSGFLWSLMRKCPYLVTGLQRAGFKGGWLQCARPLDQTAQFISVALRIRDAWRASPERRSERTARQRTDNDIDNDHDDVFEA